METRRDAFQAIADPTRREILFLLVDRPLNLNSLAEKFDMSRQAVSLHVKILEECGLINISREGRECYCILQPQQLEEVNDWLKQFREMWESRFNKLDNLLSQMKSRKEKK